MSSRRSLGPISLGTKTKVHALTTAVCKTRWRISPRRPIAPLHSRGWLVVLLVAVVGASTGASDALSQDLGSVISREYAIKATFLYHFANYIQWPSGHFTSASEPFVIGIYGRSPVTSDLEKLARSKKVDHRALEILTVTSPGDALQCEILFVPASVPIATQNQVIRTTLHQPVLVVGEVPDFVIRGGTVQFYIEGNRVRFAFGVEAIKRDDFKVSSKLMTLAKIVPTD